MQEFEHWFSIATAVSLLALAIWGVLAWWSNHLIKIRAREAERSMAGALSNVGRKPQPLPYREAEFVTWLPQLIEKLDEIQLDHRRSQTNITAALDALIVENRKQGKSFQHWLQVTFGGTGGGYQEMDDHEASVRERAEELMRRYGIPYEDAKERAKAALSYQPDGMAGRS